MTRVCPVFLTHNIWHKQHNSRLIEPPPPRMAPLNQLRPNRALRALRPKESRPNAAQLILLPGDAAQPLLLGDAAQPLQRGDAAEPLLLGDAAQILLVEDAAQLLLLRGVVLLRSGSGYVVHRFPESVARPGCQMMLPVDLSCGNEEL